MSSAPAFDSNFDWNESKFRMLHINIRERTSHVIELTTRIRQIYEKPYLIDVNATFLNRTSAHITLESYELIARRG